MSLLCATLRADVTASHTLSSGAESRLHDLRGVGPARALDVLERLDGGLAPTGSLARDDPPPLQGTLAAPPPAWVNRFVTFGAALPRPMLERQSIWDDFYGPLETVDQARILVYAEGRFVRWVGCIRTHGARPFGRSPRAAMAKWAPATAWAFALAEQLDRADLARGGRTVLVADAAGRVTMRSEALAEWLRAPGRAAELAEMIRHLSAASRTERRSLHGFELELVPLETSAEPHWLVFVGLPEGILMAAAATLTPRQREIAELLVLGATLQETAAALSVSLNTVKHHVKRIHDELGVASRAELVRALSRGGERRDP